MIWEKLQSDKLFDQLFFHSASNMFYAFENVYLFLVCVRKSKEEKMNLNERMKEWWYMKKQLVKL